MGIDIIVLRLLLYVNNFRCEILASVYRICSFAKKCHIHSGVYLQVVAEQLRLEKAREAELDAMYQ